MLAINDIRKLPTADKLISSIKKTITVGKRELKLGSRFTTTSDKGKKIVFTLLSLDPKSAIVLYQSGEDFKVKLASVDLSKVFVSKKFNTMSIGNIKEALPLSNEHRQFLKLYTSLKTLKPKEFEIQNSNTLFTRDPLLLIHTIKYVTTKEPQFKWLLSVALTAKNLYHNTNKKSTDLSDDQYEALKDYLISINPEGSAELEEVGSAPTGSRSKVELPHVMGSLDKIKPIMNKLVPWVEKSKDDTYVLMDKLDGISVQPGYHDGILDEGYTRGDGVIGRYCLEHLLLVKAIPKKLPKKFSGHDYYIRAEAMLTDSEFEKLKTTVLMNPKTGEQFANARAMVSGTFNRSVPDPRVLAKVKLTAYAIMSHDKLDKKVQLDTLKEMGFDVVNHKVMKANTVTDSALTKYVEDRKRTSGFAMDGAVIEANSARVRKRMGFDSKGKNPLFGKAYKIGDEDRVQAKVVRVEYRITQHSILMPRVWIKPVSVGGVTVEHPTGHNAAYIVNNNIGPGAIIELIRSGDVIPYITKVIKPAASGKPQLPDVKEFGAYDWNETGVHLVLKDKNHRSSATKLIAMFFSTIGVEDLGLATIEKFYDAGYDSIDAVLSMNVLDILKIDGFQQTSAQKVYTNIRSALNPIDLTRLAAATSFFGRNFGISRMEKIYEEYENEMFDWPGSTVKDVVTQIAEIKGFSEDTAQQFAEGIKPFNAFFKKFKKLITLTEPEELASTELEGTSFCFTGYRDKTAESLITSHGGTIVGSVSKNTTYCVVKDLSARSDKQKRAESLGTVKVIGPTQLSQLLAELGSGLKKISAPLENVQPKSIVAGFDNLKVADLPQVTGGKPVEATAVTNLLVTEINSIPDNKVRKLYTKGAKQLKRIFIEDPTQEGSKININTVAAVQLEKDYLMVNVNYLEELKTKLSGVMLHEITHIVLNDSDLEKDFTKQMLSRLRSVPLVNINSPWYKEWSMMYLQGAAYYRDPSTKQAFINRIMITFGKAFKLDKIESADLGDIVYFFSQPKEALAQAFEIGSQGKKTKCESLNRFMSSMYNWILQRIESNIEVAACE